MFLELPDLTSNPFPRLETLKYEGPINKQTLNFLTIYSPRVKNIDLLCSTSVLEANCLQNLHLFSKPDLRNLKIECVIEARGSKFIQEMKKIIQSCDNLKKLGIFIFFIFIDLHHQNFRKH